MIWIEVRPPAKSPKVVVHFDDRAELTIPIQNIPKNYEINELLLHLGSLSYHIDLIYSNQNGNPGNLNDWTTIEIKRLCREMTLLFFGNSWDEAGRILASQDYLGKDIVIQRERSDKNKPWIPWEMLCLDTERQLDDLLGYSRNIVRQFTFDALSGSMERRDRSPKAAFLGYTAGRNYVSQEREDFREVFDGLNTHLLDESGDIGQLDAICGCSVVHISGILTHIRRTKESFIMASRKVWLDREFFKNTDEFREAPLVVINVRDNYSRDPKHMLNMIDGLLDKKASWVIASEYSVSAKAAQEIVSMFHDLCDDLPYTDALRKTKTELADDYPFVLFYAPYTYNPGNVNGGEDGIMQRGYVELVPFKVDGVEIRIEAPEEIPGSWLHVYQDQALAERDNPPLQLKIVMENRERSERELDVEVALANNQSYKGTFKLRGRASETLYIVPPTESNLLPLKAESMNLSVSISGLKSGDHHEETINTRILQRNAFCWKRWDDEDGEDKYFFHHIASWVTPRADLIEKLCATIRREAKDLPWGYSGSPNRKTAYDQVNVIFDAIQSLQLDYMRTGMTIGNSPSTPCQTVKLPSMCLKLPSVNCLDGAVLYASVMMNFGLHPLIVFMRGHAFAGWREWEPLTDEKKLYLETKGLEIIEGFDFLNPSFSPDDTFKTAVDTGRSLFNELDSEGAFDRSPSSIGMFAHLVDIAEEQLKNRIVPLE